MKTLRPIASPLFRTPVVSPICSYREAYLARPTNHERHYQRRNFLSNPFNGPQTISATRTLPYPSHLIFDVICDVSAYRHYYPFCKESVVTKTSQPATNGKTYPEEAKLVVGFGDTASEEFWSRIYCVPESIVEAVSGNTQTALPSEEIKHHNARPPARKDPTRRDEMLSHLLTRWTLRPQEQKTEVNLAIELQFTNPVYAALSQTTVPKVAEKMIEAFERRLENVVGRTDQSQR